MSTSKATFLRPRQVLEHILVRFVGIWRDRQDMEDSSDWVRGVRKREWGVLMKEVIIDTDILIDVARDVSEATGCLREIEYNAIPAISAVTQI